MQITYDNSCKSKMIPESLGQNNMIDSYTIKILRDIVNIGMYVHVDHSDSLTYYRKSDVGCVE